MHLSHLTGPAEGRMLRTVTLRLENPWEVRRGGLDHGLQDAGRDPHPVP